MNTQELIDWADKHGICIYGHRHNSDGLWGATLGLFHVHGQNTMLETIQALKNQYEGHIQK